MSDLEQLQLVFASLANVRRLELLLALVRDRESDAPGRSIGQLAAETEMTRFTTSRHLGLLVEARLVEVAQEGRRRLHRLNRDAVVEIEDWLWTHLAAAD